VPGRKKERAKGEQYGVVLMKVKKRIYENREKYMRRHASCGRLQLLPFIKIKLYFARCWSFSDTTLKKWIGRAEKTVPEKWAWYDFVKYNYIFYIIKINLQLDARKI